MDIKIYFFLFLIYAMLGWCMEVSLGLIRDKKLVNRGFMIGPYCPIYGCGAVLLTIFLSNIMQYPTALFCTAIVICGVLEYGTSYIMEKLFKARWWDYSKRKFNINGRVCLETIIPFGIFSCLIMYVTNPFFIDLLNKIPEHAFKITFGIFLSLFLIDWFISLAIISRMRSTVKQVRKEGVYDNTEEITKKVKEILLGKTILDRRLVHAFPRISIEKVKQRIRETTEIVRESTMKVKEEVEEHIKERASKVKEVTQKMKENKTEHDKNNIHNIEKNNNYEK
ncbi:MAG: hypothetical protein J6J36_08420 [Clostridia bacterium]|nr:hypothetical protein [Clostridia bacterium]